MITSLNVFKKLLKESLSTDRKQDFKLKMLIQTAKEMIDAKMKYEIAELAKKAKNEELVALLREMETHSIICDGVLLEFIDDYEGSSMDFKGYEEFIANSIDIIGNQYKEMHDKIKEISTHMSSDVEYIRMGKNSKNNPDGIIEGLGDVMNSFRSWLLRMKRSIMSFLNRSKEQINDIKNTYASIKNQNVAYESNINEAGAVSKYKTMILDTLKVHRQCSYLQLLDFNRISKGSSYDASMYQNLQKLKNDGTVTYTKVGKKFIYELANATAASVATAIIDVPANDPTPVPNDALIEALVKASESISATEEEKFYKELYEVKKQQVIDLLKEFNAKKIAIDDKVAMLITIAGKPTLSKSEYMDKMSNAAEVGEGVAEMAQNLFSMYTKAHSVGGSLRQYKDDSNSPSGTLGATFDYVFKTVRLPETNESESFISRIANRIKRFFSNFRIASKNVDMALNQI